MSDVNEKNTTTQIGYLGPEGTFSQEALLTQPDLARHELVPFPSITDTFLGLKRKEIELAFIPIENSIEGSVPETLDQLLFHSETIIQREIEIDIHLQLIGLRGATLGDITEVISYPHASGQCRTWLHQNLNSVTLKAANSTSEAAKIVREIGNKSICAVAPKLAAELNNLEILAESIEDHKLNRTRFVLLESSTIQSPSGHDKTSIACFQNADHPGSLHSILGHFSARSINLMKVESRPTKEGLGQYCFLIDFEGHVADAKVSDCLRDLHMELGWIKYLGSYPIFGDTALEKREEVNEAYKSADCWVESLKNLIGS